jgi:hypothetical protein
MKLKDNITGGGSGISQAVAIVRICTSSFGDRASARVDVDAIEIA